MIITIHDEQETEHIVPRDDVDNFVNDNIQPGQYFTVGRMYPDGWYEKTYIKGNN